MTGTGALSATLARTGTLSDGQGVFIDFWVDQATATQSIALARGVTNTSGYRRWGLALEGGKICLDTYEGTTRANSCATGSMLGLKANTGYRAILSLGQGSMTFMAQVWERDNPAVSKEIRLGMASGTWQNQGQWDFVGATYSGVLKLDVYDEFVVYRTRYTNDAADRLTKVVDALGNTTTITYDALGRKVGMNDPDMGIWGYAYNPLGQLISQTDALGQTQVFGYDGLGRMTSKASGGVTLASYLYDQGANGIGRRSRMTDTTGYTAWFYDARGQVTLTQKLIAPNPVAYATGFGYDDANRVITMSYPGGDVVTNTFDLAGQPNSLYAAGSALVMSATYNALGAPTRVSFGNGLDKVNSYFGLEYQWTGAAGPLFAYGKLRNTCVIAAGQACDSEAAGALLNTVYWYDKGGNATIVRDNVLNSKLTASYDALDRLVTARTTVYSSTWAETAPLSETYSYNAIGNLTGRYGVSTTGAITYPAAGSARPHAATGAGPNSYVYDLNGNMTVRREVSGTETFVYTQTWSIDNQLIGVTKALTSGAVLAQTSYFFDGDGTRVRKDDPDGTTLYAGPVEQTIGAGGTAEYFDDLSGSSLNSFFATRQDVVNIEAVNGFTVTPLAGMGSESWGVRFQLFLTVAVTDSYKFGVFADDGFSFAGNGLTLSRYVTQSAAVSETTSALTLTPGLVYNFGLAYLNYTSATTSVLQLLWRRGAGALEPVPSASIHARGRRDYYSFGGAVVAMKEGVMGSVTRTLSYLHGDHLGSASLATNASGAVVSQMRYKPYGEVRWSNGPGMPTDKQFTGQTRLAEGYVGTLYDYVARAYDPVLGRFISADTIVPGAGNGQALNRYAYVGNSPLRYRDPTGHMQDDRDNGGNYFYAPPIPPPSPIGPFAYSMPTPSGGSSTVPFGGSQSPPGFDAFAPPPVIPTRVYQVWGQSTVYRTDTLGGALLSALDDQLWRVPSAIGFQLFGASVDASGGLGGSLAGNGTLWLNWRSGELGIIRGAGGSLGVAIGGDLQAGLGAANGASLSWGASSLGSIAGQSYQATLTGEAAAAFGVKGDVSLSVSYDADAALPAIDRVSGKNISTLGVGVNYLTLGAGASVAVLFSPPQWNSAEVSWKYCFDPQFCR